MSEGPRIRVENASLEYRIPHHAAGSIKETLIRIAKRGIAYDLLHAVDGVSFDVRAGEVLGIIGPNGAGKSTLMKLIARVLPPTHGNVQVRGLVSPLIELGAGFNLEQTARENIVLYGALLGRDAKLMRTRCESVAEWAELSSFLDVPVRAYSSGMLARLAFAVAVDVQPDVLLIDEILSVGDSAFQDKSAQRIDQLIEAGTSVVLVSHNLSQVVEKSHRVLWLHRGRVASLGEPASVVTQYVESSGSSPLPAESSGKTLSNSS
jgi:ABC-type polysaccharide/polyol phosphate transport system ATPase subunit